MDGSNYSKQGVWHVGIGRTRRLEGDDVLAVEDEDMAVPC